MNATKNFCFRRVLAAFFLATALLCGALEAPDSLAQASAAVAKQPAAPLWTCGMHPQVIQDHPGDCPICHMELVPLEVPESAAQASAPAAKQPAAPLWTCGMHPQVIQDHPGDCPICHMELVPLASDVAQAPDESSTVKIDPVVVQNMGVRTARAIRGPLRREVRVAGFVEEAQPLIHDVSLRVSGWISRLHAHTEGLHVTKGDPLFELYSPEVEVAVEELIALKRRRAASRGEAGSDDGRSSDAGLGALAAAARRKLVLQGLDDGEVERLSRMDRAPDAVTFRSPVTGNVTEKPVVEGSSVAVGEKLLRIVDHSTVWIDARVHEQDIALVSIGQKVDARVTGQADKVYVGEVVFIHPHLDETTRTASVRMAVPNPDFELRPGMFASVVLRGELAADAVLVPREAVIDTGDRQVAFVVGEKPGHFEPRRVRTGWTGEGGSVQILEGLVPGEDVVVSGQFLLDAESRLQDALRKFIAQRAPAAADAAATPTAGAPAHQH